MLLKRVLQAVEASDGSVDVKALSRHLGVDQSALEGMIAFWVRKGRLVDRRDPAATVTEDGACDRHGGACPAAGSCGLSLAVAPRDRQRPSPEGSERA